MAAICEHVRTHFQIYYSLTSFIYYLKNFQPRSLITRTGTFEKQIDYKYTTCQTNILVLFYFISYYLWSDVMLHTERNLQTTVTTLLYTVHNLYRTRITKLLYNLVRCRSYSQIPYSYYIQYIISMQQQY